MGLTPQEGLLLRHLQPPDSLLCPGSQRNSAARRLLMAPLCWTWDPVSLHWEEASGTIYPFIQSSRSH